MRWYGFDRERRTEDTVKLIKTVLFAHQISSEAMDSLKKQTSEAEQMFYRELDLLRRDEQPKASTRRGFVKVIIACGGEGPSAV